MGKSEAIAPAGRGLPPMHPGEMLREIVLPALKVEKIGKVEVAKALGISRTTLEDLVHERQAVTPEMALRLGRVMGNGPDLWLNLQKAWDLAKARERIGDVVDQLPVLHSVAA